MRTQYLVTIEIRYSDVPRYDDDGPDYVSRKATIGVYDTFDDAADAGNDLLRRLENRFPLHVFPSGVKASKERFSMHGGCFGTKKALVTDMAYLKTPFQFFAKITTLHYHDVDIEISKAINAFDRFKTYKLNRL